MQSFSGQIFNKKIPSKMEVALRCKLLTLFKLFVNAYIVYTTHTTYTVSTVYTVYIVYIVYIVYSVYTSYTASTAHFGFTVETTHIAYTNTMYEQLIQF